MDTYRFSVGEILSFLIDNLNSTNIEDGIMVFDAMNILTSLPYGSPPWYNGNLFKEFLTEIRVQIAWRDFARVCALNGQSNSVYLSGES